MTMPTVLDMEDVADSEIEDVTEGAVPSTAPSAATTPERTEPIPGPDPLDFIATHRVLRPFSGDRIKYRNELVDARSWRQRNLTALITNGFIEAAPPIPDPYTCPDCGRAFMIGTCPDPHAKERPHA